MLNPLNYLSLEVQVLAGSPICDAATQMSELCRRIGVKSVRSRINGEVWVALPDGTGCTIPNSGPLRRWTIAELSNEEAALLVGLEK